MAESLSLAVIFSYLIPVAAVIIVGYSLTNLSYLNLLVVGFLAGLVCVAAMALNSSFDYVAPRILLASICFILITMSMKFIIDRLRRYRDARLASS